MGLHCLGVLILVGFDCLWLLRLAGVTCGLLCFEICVLLFLLIVFVYFVGV